MELTEIKERLPLATVLHYYGLKPDKNQRLRCPFHEDKTPSLQVYPKTGTCYCFSSRCPTHGKSMDVIDFILHKESCTKAEAIQKAIALMGQQTNEPVQLPPSPQ
ncbi:CHC2 zinc finger domain-containing protein, partial [uncultured Nostoc sp.]|uniref:CHC2 zinc finger domain-containing protein n=1 Tax=uncultured Nostoc sp. TaxID=340711 RepID=UPI0035C98190